MLHINEIGNNQIFTNLGWAVLDWNLDKKHNRLGQIPLYIELQKTKPSNKVEEQKGLYYWKLSTKIRVIFSFILVG